MYHKYNIIITKLSFNDAAAKWSPHCEIAFAPPCKT